MKEGETCYEKSVMLKLNARCSKTSASRLNNEETRFVTQLFGQESFSYLVKTKLHFRN